MKVFFAENLKFKHLEGIVLTQDHIGTSHEYAWNDLGYYITFRVFYLEKEKEQDLGYIKILANGFKDTSVYFKSEAAKLSTFIYDVTTCFGRNDLFSVPVKLDFYQKLNKLFGNNMSALDDFLFGLSDVSVCFDEMLEPETWDGFSAVLRGSDISKAKMRKGYQIARGRYEPEDCFLFHIESEHETFEPIEFYFDKKRVLGETNVNVLIGENGVGKTHMLECVANTLVGLQPSKNDYPYFHKVIVIAYSPFEKFNTKFQLLEKMIERDGHNYPQDILVDEYAYIGFKNKKGEFDLAWPKNHSVDSLLKIIDSDRANAWWREKTNLKRLIETLHLSIDFDTMAIPCKGSKEVISIGDEEVLNSAWLSEARDKCDSSKGILFYKDFKRVSLSSGQEIFAYLLPAIMAEIEDESLIIFDEPETYLHPTLEVALLNMLKKLLNETQSSAIIATHSAIIAREVEKKAITILQKVDGTTRAIKPSFETYGASLELILGDAFNDYNVIKPYQGALDLLLDDQEHAEGILKDYVNDIGDDGLIYATSKFISEAPIEIFEED